jgi:ankyrin repeat protein
MRLLPFFCVLTLVCFSLLAFAEELPPEAQAMLDDLGAPDVQQKNNGKMFRCTYGGRKTVTVSFLEDATLFSGDYNNCREAGLVRDGYYELIVRDWELIGRSTKNSINAELHDAVQAGDVGKAKKLIKKRADVNFAKRIDASGGGYIDGWTPLMSAAMKGDAKMVNLLIRSGAWVNYMNSDAISALWLASGAGNLDAVKSLVKNNAYINNRNNDDVTPLMYAAMNGHDQIVKYLLNKKANFKYVHKDGDSAMMLALAYGHNNCARLLVESGALINIQNKFGISPLLIAVSEGNEDMVRLLLDNNADRTLKTDGGKTALDIATARGNENIIKLLK